MTSLQAEYSKILENRRHDIATEQLGQRQLDEDTRHHIRTEEQADAANAITKWSKEVDAQLSRERMANDRSIAELKAASDQLIQSMKGEIEQRKLDQYERELNASIAKMRSDAAANTKQAEAAYMKSESDRDLVDAKNAQAYAVALKAQTEAYANWRGTVTKVAKDAWGSAIQSSDKLISEISDGRANIRDVAKQAASLAGLNPFAKTVAKVKTSKSDDRTQDDRDKSNKNAK